MFLSWWPFGYIEKTVIGPDLKIYLKMSSVRRYITWYLQGKLHQALAFDMIMDV